MVKPEEGDKFSMFPKHRFTGFWGRWVEPDMARHLVPYNGHTLAGEEPDQKSTFPPPPNRFFGRWHVDDWDHVSNLEQKNIPNPVWQGKLVETHPWNIFVQNQLGKGLARPTLGLICVWSSQLRRFLDDSVQQYNSTPQFCNRKNK